MTNCLILRSLLKIKNLTDTKIFTSFYRKFYIASHPTMGEILFILDHSGDGHYKISCIKEYDKFYRYYDISLLQNDDKTDILSEEYDYSIDKDIDLNISDMELVLLFSREILDINIKSVQVNIKKNSLFYSLRTDAEFL